MSEYIERETVNEVVKHAWAKGLEPTQYIDIIPAADVAPVVRCKDCSHCSIEGALYLCALWNHLTELDDFCSDGKRWEENP